MDRESDLRAALPLPPHGYQASSFKLTQRSAFRIGLNAPIPQHEVGDNKGIVFTQALDVPERQSDQQCLNSKLARLTHPGNGDGPGDELALDR